MFQFFVSTVMCFFSSVVFAADSTQPFSLVHYGDLSSIENGVLVSVKEYRISLGDPSNQDRIASSPDRTSLGAFAMNAAFYFHNDDGSWNVFNFRLPSLSFDEAGTADRAAFRDYISKPEVGAVMERPYEKTNFGSPGDYIYREMNLATGQLPEPFRRFPASAMEKIESILIYNVDSTAKIYFRKPHDLEGKAQAVFAQIFKAVFAEN